VFSRIRKQIINRCGRGFELHTMFDCLAHANLVFVWTQPSTARQTCCCW
jgi:hypothetical protein